MHGIESRLQTLRDRVVNDRGRPLDALSIAAIGHELSNLMTPAIARSQRAMRDPAISSAIRKDLEAILHATQRATELGDLMLAATSERDDAGCELGPVANEVAAIAGTESLVVAVDVDGSLRSAVPGLAVRHTLLNLISNASRAMGGSGRIEIVGGCSTWNAESNRSAEAAAITPTVWLDVLDEGPGVPVQDADRLFERGVGRSGGGLGLAIGKRLIERHGGSLRLASSSPDGCVFRLELPAMAAEQA